GYAKLVNTATPYPIEGVTATDETNDLALLKVTVHGILPLDLGDSDAVQIGETVYVAGNPMGFEGTFSDGIISGRRDTATKKERLQMTAPISPGSSGGPVLNRKGEVIGVSTSIYNPLFGQNLNFAVPSKALEALLHQSGEAKPIYSNAPDFYDTYLLRGNEKILSGDYEGAIREFTLAIRLNPNNDDNVKHTAIVLRGVARNMLGQYSLAIANFDAAILLKSDDAALYYNRGAARIGLAQYSAAIRDFQATIRLAPNEAYGYFGRGWARIGLNQTSMARTDLGTALRLATRANDLSLKAAIEKFMQQLEQ
ncbi:MAG: trypsin-like peptidase domain-containing protein, partial [Candidatus Poribacteria bacterium]|nr:trypsin-like peptidase domain-containing protein [Candidatus Poribacteria bacterium]